MSFYHHHQYHSIIAIIIITLSPSSIVHQFIKIIICITSFCMSITITLKNHFHNLNQSHLVSCHIITHPLWISWSNWLLDSILGFGHSLGLFLVLVASITINLIQISCRRPSGHDSGQTAVSGDQNPILFHA